MYLANHRAIQLGSYILLTFRLNDYELKSIITSFYQFLSYRGSLFSRRVCFFRQVPDILICLSSYAMQSYFKNIFIFYFQLHSVSRTKQGRRSVYVKYIYFRIIKRQKSKLSTKKQHMICILFLLHFSYNMNRICQWQDK